MRIAFRLGEADLDLDLALAAGEATVADVATALADGPLRPDVGVLVDGAFAPPSWPVGDAGLREGSCVELATGPLAPSTPAHLELRVVGGLSGGERHELAPGTHVVGRQRSCGVLVSAASVSSRHAQLDVADDGGVTISDLDSTNGTRVDGAFVTTPRTLGPDDLVQLGAIQFACRPRRVDDHAVVGRPGPHGLTAFNRPPRGLPPAAPAPVRLPSAPGDVRSANRFGWAALLAPVAVGITLAVLWDPRMAFFALFSPVMMIGNWIEDRRRVKRERRDGGKKYHQRLADAAAALGAARTTERRRLFAVLPDVAEVQRRAEGPSNRLWERRPAHDDFLRLRLGIADVPWTPPVAERAYSDRPPEVDALVAEHGVLEQAPLAVDLGAGRCLGLVGPRAVAVAVLRSLVCQTATHHGPADVRVAVLTEGGRADDWDWAKWLPHTRSLDEASGRRLLGATRADVDAVLAELSAQPTDESRQTFGLAANDQPTGPTTLLVVDADGLTEGRNAPARELLAGTGRPVAGIVLAPSGDRLPAACTSVVTLEGPDGRALYEEPGQGLRLDHVLVAGMAEESARASARALARLEDPEVPAAGGNLPDTVALLELLDIDRPTAEELLARWRAVDTVPRVAAPIGVTERGPMVLDLVNDGPHGLVAGTTGSGKSELLRSLVASLAASVGPDHLNFVLVDYKGGSAFDACAELPHTVGLVTDLDEHLGRRALRCLEAELHYRERRLREAGATDLAEYLLGGNPEPLPRLLVVMDEFAAVAAELPDFVDKLVDVAQRGRSLGVHLLLATQRPTGVVNDHIKANTNLRVALRVQDMGDSMDVIGGPAAAGIGRSQAGRGFVRLGPGELLPFQAALSTGATAGSQAHGVEVRPFTFGAQPCGRSPRSADADENGTSDLALLVAAARAAAVRGGIRAPRRPWLEPLTTHLLLDRVSEEHAGDGRRHCAAPIGLVDEPDHQRQRAFWWDADSGHLLLYGVAGSGTTTALSTIAVSLARTHTPAEVHLYVLDFGTGALTPLADLPHVGAVVGAGERDRQVRLIRQLRSELERRRRLVADAGGIGDDLPAVVLLVDNYGGFAAAFDDFAGNEVREQLHRVVADGAGLGMYVVFTADRVNAIPSAVSTLVPERLAFRLGDRYDYGAFGLPTKEVPKLDPGRCLHAESHLEVQIALPGPGSLADAVAQCGRRGRGGTKDGPPPVGSLPKDVRLVDVAAAARVEGDDWLLPVGVGDDDLEPVGFRLGHADHALVTGPARSGKSTTLAAIAEFAAASRPETRITALAFRRSPLRDAPAVHRVVTDASEIDDAMTAVANDAAPQLVLVDDADLYEDPTKAFSQLLALRRPDVHLVAAGRADALRTNYGHWTVEIRRSRQGFALRPEDMDTELWNVSLPRHHPVHLETGRGYLVADGRAELTQGARP
jgi:S-DNA-T family DNA segregation ATPase FtsK/SpoIIIE